MRYSRILGTGSYLPEKTLSNADLEKMVDTNDEWITQRTGIKSRHIRSESDTTVSMGTEAAKKALEVAGIDKNKIGMVILSTSSPDRLYPCAAAEIQANLGLNNTCCPGFDLNAACSGFIYALSVADQFIRSGFLDYVLVIGSESITKMADWTDRATCILLGDGAGAVVLGADTEPGILSTHLHADGSYGGLITHTGDLYDKTVPPSYFKMHGNEVFKIAVTKLGDVIDEALAANNLKKQDINWLVPHQANLRIIQATAKKLEISLEQVILTIAGQGNTASASVPLALDAGIRDGRIKRGDMVFLEAFSAGLAWGAAVVKY
ncbi:MAG: 3-oxoacyl-ACP synthase [Gammaproteobacteria bacterium GWE2_37_16]|nr:MAG: 3-oxoacyl-ACP synthase [Gammaproteobacteria bacterium GWE2_37_16]